MAHFKRFLFCFLVLTLSIWLFNACSGAISKRAEILRSIGTGLDVAPPVPEEESEQIIEENTEVEEEPEEPDDPKEFNYFPYDLQLDTIAYMGCENNNFFTFKAGSYFERSGLRLSEYFLRKKSSMSQGQLKELIESSTKHQAIPYLSIAYEPNLTSVPGTHPSIVQFPIRLSRYITDLINTGNSRLRNIGGDPIETEISYGLNAVIYARELNKKWRLLLSYKGGRENKTLHKTGGDWGVDVYGRVYRVSMDEKINARLLSRYVISSVSEEKRPQAPPQPDWVCPQSLRFEIRRHPDIAYDAQTYYNQQHSSYKNKYPTLTEALNAEDPVNKIRPDESICVPGSSGGSAYTVARTVLGNGWNINTSRKCISLKSASNYCYEITRLNKPDFRLANTNADCSAKANNYCPRFLSICVRKN
jgi:hypothetical protein